MATSGVIYGARQSNQYGPRLELHWSVVSQDITKNTSHIKVVSIFNVDGYINYGGNAGKTGSTTIGGITKSYTSPTHSRTARTRTLGTTYHTVTHDSTGNYTGTLSGTFNVGSLSWSGKSVTTISASGTVSFPQILRGVDESSISFVSGWSSQDADKTIEFTKLSSSARVELIWEYWSSNHSNWAVARTLSSDYTSGTSFNHGATYNGYVYVLNPNSKEVDNRYTLNVYQGTQLIQTYTRIVREKLTLEAPTITLSVSCSGINQASLKSETKAVQGVHNMTATVSGTGKKSATIKSFKITFQGASYSQSTIIKKVTQSGTLTITAQIWDSRGATSKTSKTITSIPYSPPKLSNLVASRYDGTSISPIGTDWKVTGTIEHTPITGSDGTKANYPSWWFNSESPTYSSSVLRSGSGLSLEKTISWTLTYRDSFSQEYKYIVKIGTGKATFVMGKDSVGVGMVPPANSKGLFVKDNLINGAIFGGAELTSDLIVIADGMKNGEVKFFMTSGAYPFGAGNEQFAWGFIARRWAQRYIVAFGLDNKIYMRSKSSDTAAWTSWVAK